MKLKDRTKSRCGRLTIIKRSINTADGRVRWLCRCDCGSEIVVRAGDLQSGKTKSCGCLRSENTIALNHGRALSWSQASFNVLYDKYKYAAKRRGLDFNLTKEDFSFLTKMNCFYCGIIPSKTIHPKCCATPYIYNGIDRIDNTKGYTTNNIVACCERCNKMKGVHTTKEFREHILNIAKHRNWGEDNGN